MRRMSYWMMALGFAAVLGLCPGRTQAVPVAITNSSFESPTLAMYGAAAAANWSGSAYAYYPSTTDLVAVDGHQVLFCNYYASWFSDNATVVSSIPVANAVFTFSVNVAKLTSMAFAGYKMELLVDNASVAALNGPVTDNAGNGVWFTRSVSYTTTAGDVGKKLGVRLSVGDNSTGQVLGYHPSVAYDNVTLDGPEIVAAPAMSPAGGHFNAPATVTLSCATGGTTIYYTTNGTEPDNTTGTLYTAPFTVNQNATLKAKAFGSFGGISPTASNVFAFGPALSISSPSFELASGSSGQPTGWFGSANAWSPGIYLTAADGSYVLCCINSVWVTDNTTVLSSIPQAGATYALTIQIAKLYTYAFAGYKVEFLVNGAQAAVLNGARTDNAGDKVWFTRSLTYTTTASDVGKPLQIRLSVGDASIASDRVAYDNLSVYGPEIVAAPTMDPAGGLVTAPAVVHLSCSTSGAVIRYTTDGSEPTSGSPLYADNVTLTQPTTLKAKAFGTFGGVSTTTGNVFILGPSIPINGHAFESFESPAFALYGSGVPTGWTGSAPAYYPPSNYQVAADGNQVLFCAYYANWLASKTTVVGAITQPGATYALSAGIAKSLVNAFCGYKIEFLVDNASVAVLNGPVTDNAGNGVWFTRALTYTTTAGDIGKALSIQLSVGDNSTGTVVGYHPSVAYDNVSVYGPEIVAAPTMAPAGGIFTAPVAVTLSCGTTGASIYYTTDGSEPTQGSSLYNVSLTLTQTATLKAKAFGTSGGVSTTTSNVFILGPSIPINGHAFESFESPTFAMYYSGIPTGWTGSAAAYYPDPLYQVAADGHQVLFCAYYANWLTGKTAVVNSIAQSGATYALSTGIAKSLINAFCGYKIEFLVDNTSVATLNGPVTDNAGNGVWFTRALTYTTTAGDIGKTLSIQLSVGDNTTGAVLGYHPCVAYDNVSVYGPETVAAPTMDPAGGNFAADTPVTLSCSTTGASIYYTTDGSEPTQGSSLYNGSLTLTQTATLKAKAFGTSGAASTTTSNLFVLARPRTIPYASAVTVDGNLSEWATAEWASIDQPYYLAAGGAALNADVPEAYYAAKWGPNNRLYVAVKVRDLHHVFKDTYDDYNTRDAVEIYVHTTGSEPNNNYYYTQASAQQYSAGIKASDHAAVWTGLGYKLTLPAEANFQAAGKVDGEWLCYEVALTPYQLLDISTFANSVVSPLAAGQAVGLDVVVDANDNITGSVGDVGNKSENMLASKHAFYTMFGQHTLGAIPTYTAADLAAMLTAMDSTSTGGGNWNAAMDLDSDGAITSTDLSILLANMQ